MGSGARAPRLFLPKKVNVNLTDDNGSAHTLAETGTSPSDSHAWQAHPPHLVVLRQTCAECGACLHPRWFHPARGEHGADRSALFHSVQKPVKRLCPDEAPGKTGMA